jgi:DNA-directed RNA polymerase specialized sigma24 family protein
MITDEQTAFFEELLPKIRSVVKRAAYAYPERHREDVVSEAILATWVAAHNVDLSLPRPMCKQLLLDKAVYAARDEGRNLKRQDELKAPRLYPNHKPMGWITNVFSLDELISDSPDSDTLADEIPATGTRQIDPVARLLFKEKLETLTKMPQRWMTALVLDREDAEVVLGVSRSRVNYLRVKAIFEAEKAAA